MEDQAISTTHVLCAGEVAGQTAHKLHPTTVEPRVDHIPETAEPTVALAVAVGVAVAVVLAAEQLVIRDLVVRVLQVAHKPVAAIVAVAGAGAVVQ